MKRSITLSSLCLFAALANAQPVLTFSGNAPVAGTSYTLHYSPYVSPGQAGADQAWNLAALGTDSMDVIQLVLPAATANGPSFPGSTVAETGAAASMYWRAAADGMYFVGSDASDLLIVNSDEGKYLPFPCTYQTTWSDDVIAAFTSDGFDVFRNGTITGTADGYGTLTMPFGNVNDVLRIHWHEETSDSTEFFVFESVYDSYLYYAAGQSYPLVQLVSTSITFMGQTTTTEYAQWVDELNTGATGTSGPEHGMDLFPVPVSGTLNISLPEHFSGSPLLAITDAEGRTVRGGRNASVTGRRGSIDVVDLAAGMYQLTAVDENGQRATRRFIVD